MLQFLSAALLASAAALAGCAGATRDPRPLEALPAAMPASWQAPLPRGDSRQSGAGLDGFDDTLLPSLIAAAQSASPTQEAAAARVERARAARAAAGAALQPRLAAVGQAGQSRSAPALAAQSTIGLDLQATWEVDLFGAIAAGRDAAQARLAAARAGWHDARIAVAAETAGTYVALRACEAQAGQAQADARSRDETARLIDLSAQAGLVAPGEAALVRAGTSQSHLQAMAQRAQCDTLLKSLVELTAIDEPELRARLQPGQARVPRRRSTAIDLLPAALLAQRPDLVQAAQAVTAAAGEHARAAALEKPQLSLSGSIGVLRASGGGETTRGTVWTLGPLSVSFPLFDGGARSADVLGARASYDEAVALYKAQLRRAVREVEAGLVALQASTLRLEDAERAQRDFELALRATASRQQGGLANLLDLEAARRNAVAAQSVLIELQREHAAAWIALYRALGGGFSAGLPADPAAPRS